MPLSGPPLEKPISLLRLLDRGLEGGPDEPALVSAESRWTWRQLEEGSRRLAGNLLALGLRPGDRVASLMPNCTALLVHYLACIRSGLVATPLNYRYMPPEVDHALEVSGAAILLAHAERDADVATSKIAARLPLGVLRHGAGAAAGFALEELLARGPDGPRLPDPDPRAPAFIFFTSGSTGPSKGVTHSLETLGWIAASIIAALEWTPADEFLTASSLSHAGGVTFALAALAAGARVLLARTPSPDELLPLLRAYRPTAAWLLPTALIALVRDHGVCKEDFASLRLCMSGGDKASVELEREFTALTGLEIHESYGMTEVGCATVNPPNGVNRPGSMGRPCPGYTLSIRDEAGRELPPGSEGRLWIRSPCTTIGYWGDPDAYAATVRDGWLDTGDVVKADEDGHLWFRGRRKQIIVHDGSNICPQEVEDALLQHPAVACAGVVGVHDLVHGENVRAYITLEKGAGRPSTQELIQLARLRVGYKAPEEVVVLDAMPLTPAGKVDRSALKRMAEARLEGGGAG